MSVSSDSKTLKPDTVVETKVSKQLDTLRAENKKLQQDLKTTKSEREQALANYANSQAQLATAEQKIDQLATDNQNLQQQLEEVNTKLSESVTACENLQKQLDDETARSKSSDYELKDSYDLLNWLKPWAEIKQPKKAKWIPTDADAKELLQNVKKQQTNQELAIKQPD